MSRSRSPFSRYGLLFTASGALSLLSSIFIPSSTETAAANGDTRTLYLYHSHTGESIEATFRVNGSYDSAVLEKLNYFLRDWRNNDVTRMDPRLFDVIWEVYRTAGVTTQPIVIVSAYRSPQTNAMLRRRSHGVAEHSQHILGKAMDTTMPGMPMEKIREIGMRLQRGGVGWYPGSNFVHLDVGGVRSWPRMSYDQLARLFPDGKTVHLAADGRALPRYAEARAEIAARGGVMSDVAQAGAAPVGRLFAWLFGKHDEDDEDAGAVRQQAPEPQRGRGGAKIATLPESDANAAGEAQTGPANNGKSFWPTATPVQAKYAPATPAGADRVRVADMGATPGLQNIASERIREKARAEDAETNLKAKIDMRAAPAVPGPIPPARPEGAESMAASAPANVPLPPERPAGRGSIAVAFAGVPMPPARPASLRRFADAAEGKARQEPGLQNAKQALDAADGGVRPASSDNLLARAASLPVLITQGPKDSTSVPKQVLAFASAPSVQDSIEIMPAKMPSDAANQSAAQPSAAPPPRGDRARSRSGSRMSAVFPAQSILGQSLTGLRRAARIIPDVLSSRPSAKYVSSFGAAATDLDTSRFSGTAATPISLAGGFVRMESPQSARDN